MSNRPKRKPTPPPAPLQAPDVWSAAQSDEERLRLAAFVLRDDGGVSMETRVTSERIALAMGAAVARGEGDLVLEVRCSSDYRDKPCREVMARVWRMSDGGHYIRWQHRTSPQFREVVLLQAMDLRQSGMPNVAKATEQQVEDEVRWTDACLEAPSTTDGEFLLVCSRHGHVNIERLFLYAEAKSTRRVLNVDVGSAVLDFE